MSQYHRKLIVLITVMISVALVATNCGTADTPSEQAAPAEESAAMSEREPSVEAGLPTAALSAAGRPILTLSAEALDYLAPVLEEYGLSIEQVNPEKAVTLALPELALPDPQTDAIIFASVPLAEPPTETEQELFESEAGVIIGILNVRRLLPLPNEQFLPVDLYAVKVQGGQTIFANGTGEEVARLPADVRSLERNVEPPETIVTTKDICYSWYQVQVCTEPSAAMVFDEKERAEILVAMDEAVTSLTEVGLLEREGINIDGTMPDLLGATAVEIQQASLLVAPTMTFPDGEDKPIDGALLGAIQVLLPIDGLEHETVPEGAYAAWAMETGPDEWWIRLESAEGESIEVPARSIEVRGKGEQPEPPMAILLQIRIILCWGEC